MAFIAREQAAEALCKASPPALDLPWADLPADEREPYYEAADAVLSAINHQGAVAALRRIAWNGDWWSAGHAGPLARQTLKDMGIGFGDHGGQ